MGGTKENVLIGDYGQVYWVDESGSIVAKQGGGKPLPKVSAFEICTQKSHNAFICFHKRRIHGFY